LIELIVVIMSSSAKSSRRSLPAFFASASSASVQASRGVVPDVGHHHDLDLYYIRQIASHMKEYDLEQKIDVEIRIREGTTKLLAACQHPSQALEAAKTLQTSNQRMNVYMNELQSRKRDSGLSRSSRPLNGRKSTPTASSTSACHGRLGLTDLRLPLMWKDTDYFKNRGDYRRFAVFCLAKVGTEVLDTSLVTPVDRSSTDITFADAIVFSSARPDFQLKLEVYSCMLQDDLSIASTPRKLQRSLHSSISRTLGRKLSSALKDANVKTDPGPKFDLVATATLSLDHVNDTIKSHDLILENLENPCHQLPLFDHFCCRLAAQPDCLSNENATNACLKYPSFRIKSKSSDPPALFAVLRGFTLEFWKKREHRDKAKSPLLSLSLDHGTRLSEGIERGDIIITNVHSCEEKLAEFRCLDKNWICVLHQRIADSHAWGPVSRNQMLIHSPKLNCSPNNRLAPRSGSLYEETPLFDEPKSTKKRPTVHEVFNFPNAKTNGLDNGLFTPIRENVVMAPPVAPPSPPNTRSRSSSTSTSSSSLPSWGSVRGLPNFWRFARASIRKGTKMDA
jgi:hypothetical protein